MRVFIALAVPDHSQPELDKLCHGSDIEGMHAPQDRHMTLAFLGDMTEMDVSSLVEAISEETTKLVIEWKGYSLGPFPSRQNPKVWALEGDSTLRLDRLRQQLLELSLVHDRVVNTKGFRPHVSLARAPGNCPSNQSVSVHIRFNRLSVLCSDPKLQNGVRYKELAGWTLE